jgi:nicotinate dehydrogenase subunit B
MKAASAGRLSRRGFLAGAGALVVSFSLLPRLSSAQEVATADKPLEPGAALPGSLKGAPMFDSWIRIDADGGITVFTGKVELGQGYALR